MCYETMFQFNFIAPVIFFDDEEISEEEDEQEVDEDDDDEELIETSRYDEESQWHIEGRLNSEGLWTGSYTATHPIYGIVCCSAYDEMHYDSEEAIQHFMRFHGNQIGPSLG